MKHTNRMLLIPEDVYQKLIAGSNSSNTISSIKKTTNKPTRKPFNSTTRRLAAAKQGRLPSAIQQQQHITAPEDPLILQGLQALATASSSKHMASDNDDYARNVHYQQEFRRLKKLTEDRDERPIRVTFAAADDEMLRGLPSRKPPPAAAAVRTRKPKRRTAGGRADDSAPLSSSTAASSGASDDDDGGGGGGSGEDEAQGAAAAATVDQIMAYLLQNSATAGITGDGVNVINPQTGDPIRTSNVREIVEFAVQRRTTGRAPMTPPNLRRESLPTGYSRFLQNVQGDPYLRAALGNYTEKKTPPRGDHRTRKGQYGKGSTDVIHSFKRLLAKKEYMKGKRPLAAFKPQLW